MKNAHRVSISRISVTALACVMAIGMAASAQAQSKGKSIQTEAIWVSFDAGTKSIKARVSKPGRRLKDKEIALKRGKEASFDVIPEGSVLTRTSVAVNGRKGELADIPVGKTVNIYWVVDESKPTKRFARKIDIIFSEEELAERYGFDD